MFKPLTNLVFVIIFSVAFIGQSKGYLSSESSDLNAGLQTDSQPSSNREHSSAESASEGDCCDVECCEDECICPADACASMVYIFSNVSITDPAILSESPNVDSFQATFFISPPVYRPPIFTS